MIALRNIDDLAYFDVLLADLDTWLDVDHTRVYITGCS
jgi:poly(3-hydroxybutyrate) depolymerase